MKTGAASAAIVIFWPAAFFVGGDKRTAAELSQMKGQMVAVPIAKKCNIQFQGKPEGNYEIAKPSRAAFERTCPSQEERARRFGWRCLSVQLLGFVAAINFGRN